MIAFVPDEVEVDLLTPVLLLDFQEHERGVEGYRYFLEGEIIKESISAWSLWREGRLPSLDDRLAAVLFYAKNDAYLPVD